MNNQDCFRIAEYCKENLSLANARLTDEYSYHSLPLCVVDAVFSIGVRYTSTQNTVRKFASFVGIPLFSRTKQEISHQMPVEDLITLYDRYPLQYIVDKVFQNRQRTSPRGGILKAEAVRLFANCLAIHDVNYFQDVTKVIGNPSFEKDIAKIPGHHSGISTRYFYMLAGSDDYIKPDRMIARFIWDAIHKSLSVEESHLTITGACEILATEYPNLTPRLLDYLIWKYKSNS